MSGRRFKNRGELLAAVAAGDFAGKAMHLSVLHDAACTPSACVCSPEFIAVELTAENYQAGVRAQNKWIKETSS